LLTLVDKRRKDPTAPMEFISARKFAALVGCQEKVVPELARLGLLTTRQLPGGLGLKSYLAADAEKIRRMMITPARDSQETTKAGARGKK
jgi:hypothetical protein